MRVALFAAAPVVMAGGSLPVGVQTGIHPHP